MQRLLSQYEPSSLKDLVDKNELVLWEKFSSEKDVPRSALRDQLVERVEGRLSKSGAYISTLDDTETRHALGFALLEDSRWDSEHFGRKIGRLYPLLFDPRASLSQRASFIKDAVSSHQFDMVSARVNLTDLKTVQALEQAGAFLTDVLVTFRTEITDAASLYERPGITIGVPSEVDRDQLIRLGRSIFQMDRFHCDPYLPKSKSDELYGKWVTNSMNGLADAVLVARLGGQLGGFITCKVEPLTSDCRYGIIDLVGVNSASWGRGIGKALVYASLDWFAGKVRSVYVGTQGANTRAIKLYGRTGFTPVCSEATLHLWLNSDRQRGD